MDTKVKKRMAAVFNEWARRYAEDPTAFENILDSDGKPVKGYGEGAAETFQRIADEMQADGCLPKNNSKA